MFRHRTKTRFALITCPTGWARILVARRAIRKNPYPHLAAFPGWRAWLLTHNPFVCISLAYNQVFEDCMFPGSSGNESVTTLKEEVRSSAAA